MVEKGDRNNGFKPREFIEFRYTSNGLIIIYASNSKESSKREENRKMVVSQLGLEMPSPYNKNGVNDSTGDNGGVKPKRRSSVGRHKFSSK